MIDAEKEIMFTALYNIACGNTIISRNDMVTLAAKALEQVGLARSRRIMALAQKKMQEEVKSIPGGIEIEIDVDTILENLSK